MEENTNVITEQELELVVSEQTLGSLTTNAKQIRDLVKGSLNKYDFANYNDDNIAQAKADKAMLNKASKALNQKRIEIEREFMKPFGEFKEVVTETVGLISQCSSKIDSVVKENDERYRKEKRAFIEDYYQSKNKRNVPFEKVLNQSWLNRSCNIKKACMEMEQKLNKIEEDIESLRSFGEDEPALTAYYLQCLDLSATILYAKNLKTQRACARLLEETRIKAENERKAQEEYYKKNADKFKAEDKPSMETEHPQPYTDILYTRAFKVTSTKSKIIALGDYMNDNDIDFDKIDLDQDGADLLSKTDLKTASQQLEYAAKFIEDHADSYKEKDKARVLRNMARKINKKLN